MKFLIVESFQLPIHISLGPKYSRQILSNLVYKHVNSMISGELDPNRVQVCVCVMSQNNNVVIFELASATKVLLFILSNSLILYKQKITRPWFTG